MVRTLALLLSLLPMLLIPTPGNPAHAQSIDIPYQRFVLDNGLTLVTHYDNRAPLVAVSVWYHVGSKDEVPGRTGFAHLFEHLMFNGSEHFDDEFFLPLQRAGATRMNGTTSQDRTNYFATVPKGALDLALWLESDRMGHLLGAITQAKLNEQRGVVKNEKRQREDAPFGKLWDHIARHSYPAGHPYSWSTIGSMEDLDAASVEDVHQWFRDYYGPNNAVITLAGDITAEEALARVKHYFGAIPAGKPVSHAKRWIAKRERSQRDLVRDKVPNPRLYLVWNTPGAGERDATELELLADILAGAADGPLTQRLVHEEKLATRVTAFQNSQEIGGQFWIIVDAAPGQSLPRIEQTVGEEIARLRRDGPQKADIASAKTHYRASFLRGLQQLGGFGGRAEVLAWGETYFDNPAQYRSELTWINEASTQGLRSTARRWLDGGVYVVEVEPEHYAAPPGATDADRSALPAPGAGSQLDLPDIQRARLANGLELVLMPRSDLPLVALRWQSRGGWRSDATGLRGVTRLMGRLLTESNARYRPEVLASRQRRLGAVISAGSDLETSYVELSALRENLQDSVALFADVLRFPAFERADIARVRAQQLATIQREKADPAALAWRVLPRLLFPPQHPYAAPLTGNGSPDTLQGIDRARLRQHWHQLAPANSSLIATGAISMEELKQLAERHFANWQQAAPPAVVAPAAGMPARAIYLVDMPGAAQASVVSARRLPPRISEQRYAMALANDVFGGVFTSRLNMNLREDKHWAYGARSQLVETGDDWLWIASAQVQADKAGPALAEMRAELNGIAEGRPVNSDELAEVKAYRIRRQAGELETVDDWLAALAEQVRFKRPDDAIERYADEVRRTRLTAVQDVSSRWLKSRDMQWLVVGDLRVVKPQLEALGWLPVVVLE